MRTVVLVTLLLFYSLAILAQEKPDWVKQRPVNTMYYTGIARVLKSEKDYMEKAKAQALRDLISEIKVTVSANSLLKTLEQNGVLRSDYEETIKTEASESIEKYELVDSWQNDEEYWVYYQLNRFDYEEYITRRREQAIRTGFDYWYKGEVALQQGELITALEFYLKGLDAVQAVANEPLTCQYEGQTLDVGRELYASLNRAFEGISILATPKILEGKAFEGIKDPLKVRVVRKGVALKNLSLNSRFVTGSGQLSEKTSTDENGELEVYVHNITSKLSEQEITVSLDPSSFSRFKNGVYNKLINDLLANSPCCTISVRIGQSQLNAYMMPASGTDKQLQQSVQRILTTHYFNMVPTPAEADLLIKLNSDFRRGEKTSGDMRDFVTYYAGVNVRIENNRDGSLVANFALEDIKVLQPSTASESTARGAAVRELTRQMQRGLNKTLAGLNINREGERNAHPVVEEEPEKIPETEPQEKSRVNPKVKPVIIVIERKVEKETGETPEDRVGSVLPTRTVEKETSKVIEGELLPGFFIRYVGIKKLTDRTMLTFSVLNGTGDDRELYLTANRIKVINEKGEEVRILNIRIGSSGYADWAKALVATDVPTSMILEVKPLEKAVLVQVEDNQGHIVKLRNMQ